MLALGAKPEEFQLVRHSFEPVIRGNPLVPLAHKTLLDLNDRRAPGADQVMMVAIVAFRQELEAGHPIAQIIPFHHPHALEQAHRAIDGHQVAIAPGQCREKLLGGHRMRLLLKDFQDGLPRSGDLVGLPAQPLGQIRLRRAAVRMGMGPHVNEAPC